LIFVKCLDHQRKAPAGPKSALEIEQPKITLMEKESTKGCESRRSYNNREQNQEDENVMEVRFLGKRQERREQVSDPVRHCFSVSIRGIPTENQKLHIFKYEQRERNSIWQFIVLHHGIQQVEEDILRIISLGERSAKKLTFERFENT
jgi:hypothetical protein